jgi:hypothetical protein
MLLSAGIGCCAAFSENGAAGAEACGFASADINDIVEEALRLGCRDAAQW